MHINIKHDLLTAKNFLKIKFNKSGSISYTLQECAKLKASNFNITDKR